MKLKRLLSLILVVLMMSCAGSALATNYRATANTILRSKPSASSPCYGQINKGNVCKYLGSTKKDSKGKKWMRVSFNGKKAWVAARYMKKTGDSTGKYLKTTAVVWVHKEPKGTTLNHDGQIGRGKICKVLKKSGNWRYVTCGDKKGWIHIDNVTSA